MASIIIPQGVQCTNPNRYYAELDRMLIPKVQQVAAARVEWAEKMDLLTTIYGSRDPNRQEFQSLAAEVAFCELIGTRPDYSVGEYRHYDTIRINDQGEQETIDVKWTDYVTGVLLAKVKPWKIIPTWFVMVYGECPNFYVLGRFRGRDLLVRDRIGTGPTGRINPPGFIALQDELTRIHDWVI